jgi:YesN/AraC family two-component response regulator
MKIETKYTQKVYSNYRKHHHDMLAISMIKEGKVKVTFDDKEELLLAHQLAIFNPFENHKTIVVDEDTAGYHVIYFDLHWCEDIQKIDIFNPIALSIIDNKEFVDRFISLCISQDINDAELFLSDIFHLYCDPDIKKEKRSDFLEEVVAYMEKSEELSLDELSRYFSISKNHLIRFCLSFTPSLHAS